jgi:hypothetical protein
MSNERLSKRPSFPRKRESSPSTAHLLVFAGWIPAFAGMTATRSGRALQMTQVPARQKAKVKRLKAES